MPPQQQRTPGMSRDDGITLFVAEDEPQGPPRHRISLRVLLVTGFVAGLVWVNQLVQLPPQPGFTVAALSVSGGQVTFNVSDSTPNGHYSISYKGNTRASLLFDDAAVASGQANRNTTFITSVLDVVDEPSFNATLRTGGGRLPLRLQLTTAISFTQLNVFRSVAEQDMYVNCDLLVGADGSLLRESVGARCDTNFFLPLQATAHWMLSSYY